VKPHFFVLFVCPPQSPPSMEMLAARQMHAIRRLVTINRGLHLFVCCFRLPAPISSLVKTALAIYLETENNSGERLGKSAGLCSDLTYAPVMEMLVARQMHAIRRMVPINRGLLVRPLANTDKQT